MPENIILIGFMGTGKSTIGRQLSLSLGYPLVDTDQLIEERTGKSIPQIFETEGEETFRQLETEALTSLAESKHHVIATGGGIIGKEENRQLLRALGYVVWLVATPEEILNRTSRNTNRPLLNHTNPAETIRNLLAQRTPLYQATSHLMIETDQLNFDEVITGIVESARYYFSKTENS